ncbi:Dot/Icm T4SS effector AnkK/LegA5 [Legionella maioricensis]|uniref:Ankyrin repeat domain-containing protein n=1 Tax=Legionella maioricensis TaxID=2896528 RepID=A0A9X2IDG6_9GAMM|nr:Dot/Icm T4SS effector AnkK/LegA5 [Legionella maioricensis]MCL9685507.1 ankyrin repeat domain-containing protein [Legionella maioricensis]MCL9688785.1 ankyrin repeat domain-containing protein [Legionella maioricensis]
MAWLYNIADIALGESTHYGHEAYIDAVYTPPDAYDKPCKVIFKRNKYGRAQLSRFEVAFTQLAQLFLAKGTTSTQRLVVDDSLNVLGMVTEHLCYVIEKKEGLSQTFFTLDNPHINSNCTVKTVTQAEEIPYYFLDKLPQGFFANLLKAEQENILSIDYSSLASILASSYTLEEDDLHKGNFGFYLVEKDGKPHAIFFKIDHDLMFIDSIMSFKTRRFFHWMHNDRAFDVVAEDLLNFPFLAHSSNFYWPTKYSYIAKPWSNKDYHSVEEIEAFTLLGENPEFKKAKWMAFYKHILLPAELIGLSLKECLDEHNSKDRAKMAVMTQATVARQARLRAVLFSIKEFRDFVSNLKQEEHELLLNELRESTPQAKIPGHVINALSSYQQLAQSEQGFEEGDTPLHIAIRFGDYRYEETLHMFGHFINKKNNAGKTPLDVAMEMAATAEEHPEDIRKDVRFTMRHLLENGAKQSPLFQQYNMDARIESYQFQTAYISLVTRAKSYQQFKDILRDIGEDHRFCLKFQKNIAIDCIARFIQVNQNHPALQNMLLQLKKDLNGDSTPYECAGLKYIRQLRSKLWIIRQIRGLYGRTSTLSKINDMVDEELERIKAKEPNCFSFFSSGTDLEESNEEGSYATELTSIPCITCA